MQLPRVSVILLSYIIESFPIYHPKVLKRLFLKGYNTLVLKILIQLNKSLEASQSAPVSEFLEFDLAQIMEEVNEYIKSQSTASTAQGKKKQETASSIFDDFYGGVNDDDDGDIFSKKTDKTKKVDGNNK